MYPKNYEFWVSSFGFRVISHQQTVMFRNFSFLHSFIPSFLHFYFGRFDSAQRPVSTSLSRSRQDSAGTCPVATCPALAGNGISLRSNSRRLEEAKFAHLKHNRDFRRFTLKGLERLKLSLDCML